MSMVGRLDVSVAVLPDVLYRLSESRPKSRQPFYRNGNVDAKIHMKLPETPNSQNNLEREGWTHASQLKKKKKLQFLLSEMAHTLSMECVTPRAILTF